MGLLRTGMANARAVLAALLTYALVAHGFMAPMVHAKAHESARIEASLGVICATDGTTLAHTDGERPVHHTQAEHECCLSGQRDLLDRPVILAISPVPAYAALFALLKIEIETADSHLPADFHLTTQRPRGPPSIV